MPRRRERLSEYEQRRSFERTPEPAGSEETAGEGSRFVVQQHHARRLHWDLRLERDGVLVSWALPRGFPDRPERNRLAVHTEDHPLEYLTFADEIPAGEYGGGRMLIWDSGTFTTKEFTERKVVVDLHGERVQGRYALFQTDGKNWLIHRMDPPDPDREPMPREIQPMRAVLSHLPENSEAWGFEVKWDGIRALAYGEPGRVRLVDRTGRDITTQYPEIGPLAGALGAQQVVLDGELVAFGDDGLPSFTRLQRRMYVSSPDEARRRSRDVPVTYVVFDVLYLDGRSLLDLPYEDRRTELAELELAGPRWQVPDYRRGDGAAFLEASRRQGLDGVVAKRLGSSYQAGRRSNDWLTVENVRTHDAVIGGWVPGSGGQGEIGALLLGYYVSDRRGRRLRYAGTVSTGIDPVDLRALERRLRPLRRDSSPFGGRQPPRDAQFVEPELVCVVAFSEWTSTGTLRHPAYRGLRDDRPASDVVREERTKPPTPS